MNRFCFIKTIFPLYFVLSLSARSNSANRLPTDIKVADHSSPGLTRYKRIIAEVTE